MLRAAGPPQTLTATDTCQVTVEPGITITALRTTSSDIRRHKASNDSPEAPPGRT